MSQSVRFGFLAALGAYTLWGMLPLYFRVLDHIAPAEMLVHRIIWSVPTGILLIVVAANWYQIKDALTWRRVGWLTLSAFLIGINWFLYIWAVSEERVVEASLGYYINPLINVILGALFFSERLRTAQWISVGIAAIGVAVITYAIGVFPWISFVLATSFAIYAVIRKQIQIDSRAGFVIETAILFPFAMIWLTSIANQPDGSWMGDGGWDIPLLLAAGPITATPLILFGLCAKRLQLSTVGMMQYIAPTIQFCLAIFVFREEFETLHAVAFGCIWLALIVFTADSVIGDAKARRLNRAAASIR